MHAVHIARLNLGLHKEIERAVYHFGENPKIANLRLVDNRLIPSMIVTIVCFHMDALNGEESTRIVFQTTILVYMPSRHLAEWNQLHINLYLSIALLNPLTQRFRTVNRIVGCKQRMYHLLNVLFLVF